MSKKLLFTVLTVVLGFLFLSPLKAMDESINIKNIKNKINKNKDNIDYYRSRRDYFFNGGNGHAAAKYAEKVITENQEAVTIEDFRKANSIFCRLAIDFESMLRFKEAEKYDEVVKAWEKTPQKNIEILQDFYQYRENYWNSTGSLYKKRKL